MAAQFLAVYNGTLQVRDYATQSGARDDAAERHRQGHASRRLARWHAARVRARPDARATARDWHFGSGQIWIRPYDQTTHTFGAEKLLVADASNNYYPSFSPDGKWVLFNKSDDNRPAPARTTTRARRSGSIKADGSAPAVKLATLDAAIGFTNSWARWAPFAQTVGTDEPIYWITVSSQRDFGVRLVGPAPAADLDDRVRAVARDAQRWIRASRRSGCRSRTSTANNHIAQWTEQIVVTQ